MFASDRDGTSARRPVCTLAMRSEDTKRSFLKSSGHVSHLKICRHNCDLVWKSCLSFFVQN